jgi:membrane protein
MTPETPRRRPFDLTDVFVVGAVAALAVRYFVNPARSSPPRDAGARHTSPSLRDPQDAAAATARSREPGRGRGARYPWEIPFEGWKDILWRTYAQVNEDRLLLVAAGVVFYAVLAIFPAISAFVSIYGLFTDSATVTQHLSLLSQVVPEAAFGPIEEQVRRVAGSSNTGLGVTFLASLAFALWSANAGMKGLVDALNVAYDEEEKRSFIKLTLVSFALTIGAMISGLVAIGAVVVFPVATSILGIDSASEAIVSALRWPILFVALLVGLSVLYRFAPSRTEPRWQWVSLGGLVAAALFLAGSAALSFYFSRFADYTATYGSLAAAVGLMMWLWLSIIVVLLGAELNSETEHQTARDSTIGPEKPLGTRGAVVADTVGAAQT